MKVQFLVKYAKAKLEDKLAKETPEEREERLEEERIQKIINGGSDEDRTNMNFSAEGKFMDMFNIKNLEIYYQPYVTDLENLSSCDFYYYDEEHVILLVNGGEMIPVKAKWDDFVARYKQLTNQEIIQF